MPASLPLPEPPDGILGDLAISEANRLIRAERGRPDARCDRDRPVDCFCVSRPVRGEMLSSDGQHLVGPGRLTPPDESWDPSLGRALYCCGSVMDPRTIAETDEP